MRLPHEMFLLVGALLVAISPALSYVGWLTLIPGVLCILLSLPFGIAHLRQCLPTGVVGVRSHLSYFVVAAFLPGMFAPGFQALCCPDVESPALAVTAALAILCALYLVPFALIPWADGRSWFRPRTAWLLLTTAVLLPVLLWSCEPTALVGAAGHGRALTVRLLLFLGHDVNQRDQFGRTPLMRAVTHADPGVVRLLLAHRAAPNAVDNGGTTALENAVRGGHLALLELLHTAGARIDGSQALPLAVGGQQGEVVDWLLAHQATVAGSGALEAAVQYADAAMVRRLLSHTPTPDRSAGLAESAARGDLELVTLFLEHGADPDQPHQDGMPPLLRAVVSGIIPDEGQRLALIDLLLEHGADLEATNQSGDTALALAVRDNRFALARHLLAQGARVDPLDPEAWTPLAAVVRAGEHLPMVKLLVEHGADLARARAVPRAAEAQWVEGLRYLLEKKGPVQQLNSALWIAVSSNHEEAVRLLLAAGAEACSEDEDRSPLALPAIQQASARVRALVDHACSH